MMKHLIDAAADHHDRDAGEKECEDFCNCLRSRLADEIGDTMRLREDKPNNDHVDQQRRDRQQVAVCIHKNQNGGERRRSHDERDADRHDAERRFRIALFLFGEQQVFDGEHKQDNAAAHAEIVFGDAEKRENQFSRRKKKDRDTEGSECCLDGEEFLPALIQSGRERDKERHHAEHIDGDEQRYKRKPKCLKHEVISINKK